MFTTLYGKLALVLLALLCLLGALSIGLTWLSTRLYVQEVTQKLNRSLAQHLVANNVPLQGGRVNEQALEEIFHMLMVINPSIEIYLLDPQGVILAHSAPPGRVQRHRVALEPIQRFLSASDTFPIVGDDPRHPERRKVFSVAPIPLQAPLEGYLYVVLAGEAYDSVAHRLQGSYILRLSICAVVMAVVCALGAGLLLFYLCTRRLRRLTAAMDAFRGSDFVAPLAPVMATGTTDSGDEIGRLGATFQAMAGCIAEQMQHLQRADALRRELIANVSHDIRTPLTVLHGYLETLRLKEDLLTPQVQRRYLDLALRHSVWLRTLVNDLFDLAKFDAQAISVALEPFALGELVQDAVHKFGLMAQQTHVKIQTDFAADLPFVLADIGLIERVLDNLIHNALSYTPPGGTVTVRLQPACQQMTVQVCDTGCGIPAEELPLVFERFYQAGNHRRPTEGTGLGLAITKRILELHQSTITVHSRVNHGTVFTFALPTWSG